MKYNKPQIGAVLAAVGLALLTAGFGGNAQAKGRSHDNGHHLGWSKSQHKNGSKSWSKNRKSDWRKTNTRNTQWRLIDTDYYRTRSRALKAASIARQRGYRANTSYDPRRKRWVVREYRRY